MVTEAPSRSVTADDLLDLDASGFVGELIRGELCASMPPGIRPNEISLRLAAQLLAFVDSLELGRVVNGDPGIVLERNPDTVRAPDIAFFPREQIPLDAEVAGYAEVVPPLIVEVRSPSDTRRDINDKALMWLSYGVQVVWVVLPEHRAIEIYHSDRDVQSITAPGRLEGGNILPGFTCELSDIFGPQPEPAKQPD